MATGWTAGIGRRCITPTPPTPWLAGYGHRDTRATGKLHDIHVKALAIALGDTDRVLLITLDICHISRAVVDAVRACLPADLRAPGALRMVASHTHSGPCCANQLGKPSPAVDFAPHANEIQSFSARLVDACVNAARDALAGMVGVELRSGRGTTKFSMNRRNDTEVKVSAEEAAQMLAGNRPAIPWSVAELTGPHDHTLDVLQLVRQEGKTNTESGSKRKRDDAGSIEGGPPRTLAVVFGYACHATTLDINLVSNDWPGEAMIELETKSLPGCTAFFATGCGGDQNPGARRHVDLCKLWGLRIAREVARVCRAAAGTMRVVAPASLAYAGTEIALPYARLPTAQELAAAATGAANCPTLLPDGADPAALEKLNATTNASFLHLIAGARKQWAALIQARLYPGGGGGDGSPAPGNDAVPYEVSCWRFGPLRGGVTWFALAGEPTVEYALALRAATPQGAVLATGYCNGSPGYIPSERVLQEGGYEGGESMLCPSKCCGTPSCCYNKITAQLMALNLTVAQYFTIP